MGSSAHVAAAPVHHVSHVRGLWFGELASTNFYEVAYKYTDVPLP